jgi:asparagine synthase (glutamine-hydrolysing)
MIWVAFNGEIYNFQELKDELETHGHQFKTHSDTEVIAHGYEQYGEECFKRFNGMFAIALWDERKRRLVLARDRLGKKPLYYSVLNETILFGSELKAIMAYPSFSRRVDPVSLTKYLFFEYIPSPHTIFRDAKKLPAATCLIWEKGSTQLREYWSPSMPRGEEVSHSETEIEAQMMDLLRRSVRKRLVSDVPLGVFLSGGIDSSTVTALAQQEVPGKVKTFSISFQDPSFDESRYSLMVSKNLGTDHYDQQMSPEDLLNLVPTLPDVLDEPMADASILPTVLLSQFTRKYVTVALGGDGGDELFAGYPTYLAHRVAKQYERCCRFSHPVLSFIGNLLPVSDDNISFDFKVKKFLSGIGYAPGVRNAIWLGSFSFPELKKVLSGDVRRHLDPSRIEEDILSYGRRYPVEDETTLLQYLDLKLYLQEAILVKVDRASMSCSLETRAPFLDYEFVDFVMGLPSNLKLRGLTSKYLLKKATRDLLPQEVIHRKKKGFGVPIAKWVKGPLKQLFGDMLSPDRIRREGFLDPDYASALLDDHSRGRKDNRKPLWTLLVWELWHDRYRPLH